jgi:VanZ family protein
MKILTRSIRIVPVLLLMGTIFFLSHQPGIKLQLPYIFGLDKLAHGVMYAALAATVLYTVSRKAQLLRPWRTGALIVFFCLLYGMTDEYHQSFVPGRVPSFGDIIADVVGASLLLYLWLRYQSSRLAPAPSS